MDGLTDYVLHEVISKNRKSKVYRGSRKDGSGVAVAVKRISTSGSYISIEGNNLLFLYDIKEVGDYRWLIYEYCNGGNLQDFLKLEGILSPLVTKYYISQIRNALCMLHEKGIVHRNLSPCNVLVHHTVKRTSLHYNYQDVVLKVGGFSTGKKIEGDDMESTLPSSYSPYTAPEIIREGRVHSTSDLWSIGVLVYTMLYGKSPLPITTNIIEASKVLETWTLTIPSFPPSCIHQRDFLRRLLQPIPEDRMTWEEFIQAPFLHCDGRNCDPVIGDSTSSSDSDSDDNKNKEASAHWRRRPLLLENYCSSAPVSIPVKRIVTTVRKATSAGWSYWLS